MSATWFSGVTLTVEIGEEAPYFEIAGTTWVDITAYVRSITTRRGRNSELDTFQAGTATFVLRNEDRRFDPNYASSPYYPNLLPMRRIRVTATYSAVAYAVWCGYVDDWPQSYDPGNRYSEVTLTATDAFKPMSLLRLPESVWAFEMYYASAPWYRLGETTGGLAVDSGGGGNTWPGLYGGNPNPPWNSTTGLIYGSSDPAIRFEAPPSGLAADTSYVHVAATTNLSTTYNVFPFTFECWFSAPNDAAADGTLFSMQHTESPTNKLAIYLQDTGEVLATIAAGSGGAFRTSVTTAAYRDEQPHHLAVVFPDGSTAPTIYVDGAAATSTPSGSGTVSFPGTQGTYIGTDWNYVSNAPSSPFYGVIDEVMLWTIEVDASDIGDHYEFGATPWAGDLSGARITRLLNTVTGIPFTDRTIGTGVSTMQSATLAGQNVLAACQVVEQSEQGQFFMGANGFVIFRDRNWRFENSSAITSQATFGDSGSELRYADIVTDGGEQFIANTIRATREGGATVTATDDTSIGDFFERVEELSGLQNEDDADLYALASFRLAARKNVIPRVTSLEVLPRSNPTQLFPQVLGRDIGHRLTVKRRPQNVGTALTYTVLVEGIEHTITADGVWSTRWYLSSVDSQAAAQPLVLDDANVGLLDTNVLAY